MNCFSWRLIFHYLKLGTIPTLNDLGDDINKHFNWHKLIYIIIFLKKYCAEDNQNWNNYKTTQMSKFLVKFLFIKIWINYISLYNWREFKETRYFVISNFNFMPFMCGVFNHLIVINTECTFRRSKLWKHGTGQYHRDPNRNNNNTLLYSL